MKPPPGGGLRVPGETPAGSDDAGAALQELQSTLASALETEQRDRDGDIAAEDLQSSCRVECNQRGEVVIESDSKISLDAPTIDIAASG